MWSWGHEQCIEAAIYIFYILQKLIGKKGERKLMWEKRFCGMSRNGNEEQKLGRLEPRLLNINKHITTGRHIYDNIVAHYVGT